MDRPPFRWAGGKAWLVKELHRFLPASFNQYHEPFVGGGAIFFNIKPKGKLYLSDNNEELINAYCQLRDNFTSVTEVLVHFHNTKKEYYKIRDTYFNSPVARAARFIYLNRTCFNGLYRVNLDGTFNVPYGFKAYKQLFDLDKMRQFSEQLRSATIESQDFEKSLKTIKRGDLVFLDPPYTVTHIKNGFVKYNEKLFSWSDQKRLARFIEAVRDRNAYYILTNAKHEAIEHLFSRIDRPVSVSRASLIGGKRAKRGIIEEYVFTNVR